MGVRKRAFLLLAVMFELRPIVRFPIYVSGGRAIFGEGIKRHYVGLYRRNRNGGTSRPTCRKARKVYELGLFRRVEIGNMDYWCSSCDIGNNTSLFHIFNQEPAGKCGIQNCGRDIGESSNGECRNCIEAAECSLPAIDRHSAINFLCGQCLGSSSPT